MKVIKLKHSSNWMGICGKMVVVEVRIAVIVFIFEEKMCPVIFKN